MTHLVLDSIVAVFVVSLPLTAFALTYRTKTQQSRLIAQAGEFGNAYVAAWVPEPLAQRLPTGLIQTMERVRHIKLRSPTDELIRAYAEIDTLTGFDFIGGQYDASSIDAFSSNVHFACVRIRNRRMNDRIAQSIAKFPWLLELELSNTSLDSEMYRRFHSLSSLRWVDLRGTKVRLSQIGKPNWASTVQTLRLPPAPVGHTDELVLDGWTELKSLAVMRSSFVVNDAAITLRLSRLPKLTTLSLNRLQKHVLYLKDLPRFSQVDEDVNMLLFSLDADDFAPGLTWLSAFHLDGVPSLTNLGCFARDLDSLSIANAPNLRRLEIGSYVILAGESAQLVPATAGDRQAWIDEIGRGDGPVVLDLTALPLKGIDLSPLVANPRIRRLHLGNSGVTFDQVLGLDGMTQLEALDLGDCPLQEDQLGWLLSHLPRLESLRVNVTMLERVTLTRNIKLRDLHMTQFERLRDLRMVDVPGLSCRLRLTRTPDHLVIKNAPLLRGFALEQPWPADAVINGLRDLEWFSAGGPGLDDSVVDELLPCQTLGRLTLAYTSVSRQKLAELGSFVRLVSLVVPGSGVDDQVTAHWHPLQKLQEVDLSDSHIGAETFQWLATINSLRQLYLNRNTLNDRAAASLYNLAQVAELEIADVQMDPKWLIAMLNQQTLERIDVSGWTLDPPLVDALANCESLESLRVSRCEMTDEALLQIAAANSSLKIDLGESHGQFSAEVLAQLGNRIDSPQSPRPTLNVIATNTSFYEVISDAQSRVQVGTAGGPPRGIWAFHVAEPGAIDAERFRQTQ